MCKKKQFTIQYARRPSALVKKRNTNVMDINKNYQRQPQKSMSNSCMLSALFGEDGTGQHQVNQQLESIILKRQPTSQIKPDGTPGGQSKNQSDTQNIENNDHKSQLPPLNGSGDSAKALEKVAEINQDQPNATTTQESSPPTFEKDMLGFYNWVKATGVFPGDEFFNRGNHAFESVSDRQSKNAVGSIYFGTVQGGEGGRLRLLHPDGPKIDHYAAVTRYAAEGIKDESLKDIAGNTIIKYSPVNPQQISYRDNGLKKVEGSPIYEEMGDSKETKASHISRGNFGDVKAVRDMTDLAFMKLTHAVRYSMQLKEDYENEKKREMQEIQNSIDSDEQRLLDMRFTPSNNRSETKQEIQKIEASIRDNKQKLESIKNAPADRANNFLYAVMKEDPQLQNIPLNEDGFVQNPNYYNWEKPSGQ